MKQISVTVTVGKGSERHNHDLDYRASLEHVHGSGVVELIPYNMSYEEKINQLMKPYIDKYNQEQQERYQAAWERYNSGQIKTKPRKRNYEPMSYDYYQCHKDDTYYNRATNQHEPLPIYRELILGLGDKKDRHDGVISFEEAYTVFQNTADSWETLFPDFKLLGATMHKDEAGFWHAHYDYKPMYDNDIGQGLTVGIGHEAAMEHMGFEPEQSLINTTDKIPIRFNAFRNKLYLEVEKELNAQGIGLLYGASKIKEPEKNSSKNQQLENWQATQDAAYELQLMKNNMIDIVRRDDVSSEEIKTALESFKNIEDTFHQIEQQRRSRFNKDNVVVHFQLFDQLKSFVKSMIDSVAYLIQQVDIMRENLAAYIDENEKQAEELQELQELKKFNEPDFKMEYAELKRKARYYDDLEQENRQLKRMLGIAKQQKDLQR